ncbi:hypothetical protein HDU99_008514 [Rhizoclosmatium hyalinum]|nr:hypothetical protein HDU99_008514 [Rhizoclosmatium hyalinum]
MDEEIEQLQLFDVKHKLSLNLPCGAIDSKAVTAVKSAVEEAASELLDEAPETETRKARIQDAVGYIIHAALDAVEPSLQSGHSLVRDCPLPAVLASADKNDSPFAIPIYYPKGGSADFVDATFYRIYGVYLSKTRDSEVKNLSLECQIQTLQSKSSNHPLLNPFENWTIKKPFMAVPDYGTSLAQLLFSSTHLNVTLEKLKNLIQGVFRNSLEPIINLGYCHMDIHLGNICVKDEEGWTDACLIDFDFATLADGRTNNRMARNRLNYPNEECIAVLRVIAGCL